MEPGVWEIFVPGFEDRLELDVWEIFIPGFEGRLELDVLEMFEADPQTEVIVMAGEIGGDAEEQAADFIAANVTKPVVGYIAGFTAPPGKTMGHAGAIVSGSAGSAQAKVDLLEARGVRVGRTPTEVADITVATLAA